MIYRDGFSCWSQNQQRQVIEPQGQQLQKMEKFSIIFLTSFTSLVLHVTFFSFFSFYRVALRGYSFLFNTHYKKRCQLSKGWQPLRTFFSNYK